MKFPYIHQDPPWFLRQVRLPETERLNYHQLEARQIQALTDGNWPMKNHRPEVYIVKTIVYIDTMIYIVYLCVSLSLYVYIYTLYIYTHRIWCGQLISSHLLRRRYVAEVSLGRVTAWALGSSWRSSGLLWKL